MKEELPGDIKDLLDELAPEVRTALGVATVLYRAFRFLKEGMRERTERKGVRNEAPDKDGKGRG